MSWEKASDLPNRIGEIKADVSLPAEISDNMRQAIHRVAEQCLIHNTISNSPHVQINIESR
jgi:uncharacterized OsmC-like protein